MTGELGWSAKSRYKKLIWSANSCASDVFVEDSQIDRLTLHMQKSVGADSNATPVGVFRPRCWSAVKNGNGSHLVEIDTTYEGVMNDGYIYIYVYIYIQNLLL